MYKDAKISELMAIKIKDSVADTAEFDKMKEKNRFVSRPILSSKITDILNRTEAIGVYSIVYGANGAGKSTIVDSAIQGRRGVLKIEITSGSTVAGIMSELAKKTGTTKLDPQIADFRNALAISVGKEGILPTIIFEIEQSKGEEQRGAIQEVRSFAKQMCVVCNIILVLSEANAALQFGKDRRREEFIFVGDLSESEARDCLKALKVELPAADLKDLFDKVGTNPAALNRVKHLVKHEIDNVGTNPAALDRVKILVNPEGISLKELMALELSEAKEDLVAFPHQRVLRALKENPEGVSPDYFNRMKSEGVDLSVPKDVAVAMKVSNALTYRMDLQRYVIISRCHEVALESYEPAVPLPPIDLENQLKELKSQLRNEIKINQLQYIGLTLGLGLGLGWLGLGWLGLIKK